MNVATELSPLRPRIALAMGDPAGIAPELTARLLADRVDDLVHVVNRSRIGGNELGDVV